MREREIYEFGPFRLDVAEHSLHDGRRPIALKPKVFETLVLLVRNAGHLLSKQELMSRLWPDAVVDETNLNKNIWLIRRALGETADSSEYVETVPRVGYRFIGAVRRVEPEPPPAVEAAPVPTPAPEPARAAAADSARPRRLPSRATIFGVLVAATAIGLVVALRLSHPAGLSATGSSRRTITVLGFRNLSNRPELDWIATALSEMVQAELAPGSSYRLMPVESAERLRRELGLALPGSLSPESLSRLRRAAAVDDVVGGSYVSSGSNPEDSRIRIDVLVQDARTGDTIAAVSESGESSRLLDLVSSIGQRLRLALREPERAGAAELSASSLPKEPEALRLYAEGLQKLRASDALAARDLLSKAVAAEPGSPMAHFALGRAYATLGYEENARLELQQALANARGLPRRDQLDIESAYRAANKEWDRAIELCRELQRLAPDDLENGLRLAGLQLNASSVADGLATIRGLRALPAPAGNDPRIDLLESRLLMRTDPRGALRAAETALAEARSRQERSIEANALLDRSVAAQTLGKSDKAPVEEAMRIFSEIGDPGGEARAAHKLGDIQFDEGDANGASASFQHAVDVSDRIGYVQEKAAAIASLSRVASLRGNSADAERLIAEANSIWRAVPDRRQLPWGLNALGSIRLGQGKLDEAIALHREAMKISRENGSYLHDSYSGLIAALAAQGKLEEASSLAEEALKTSRDRAETSWIAQHAVDLGSLELERGRLPEAGRLLGESLEIRRKLREYTVPESELQVARLRAEEGNWDEAARIAQAASAEFAAAGRKTDQAGAEALRAEAMLGGGQKAEAAKAAAAATALLDDTATADARVPVLLAHGRVENATGRAREARADVDAAARLAEKLAWKDLILETRLVEAEMDAGSPSGAAREASVLSSEARAMGFERIARRADRLARRKS
ncbi:MAG TPA: tetratricopeptide repeat protein [Thermoanaerobaculia bacterium]